MANCFGQPLHGGGPIARPRGVSWSTQATVGAVDPDGVATGLTLGTGSRLDGMTARARRAGRPAVRCRRRPTRPSPSREKATARWRGAGSRAAGSAEGGTAATGAGGVGASRCGTRTLQAVAVVEGRTGQQLGARRVHHDPDRAELAHDVVSQHLGVEEHLVAVTRATAGLDAQPQRQLVASSWASSSATFEVRGIAERDRAGFFPMLTDVVRVVSSSLLIRRIGGRRSRGSCTALMTRSRPLDRPR